MKLKDVLLDSMEVNQLKAACAELELDADRRSQASMRDALAGSKKAKPERLLAHMTAYEMRAALEALGEPTEGNKAALAERLLAYRTGGGTGDEPIVPPARDRGPSVEYGSSTSPAPARVPTGASGTAQYEHGDRAVQRPDAGVQDQFQARKPPKTYRYDSSLDPALAWDEQRERDLGEWLLGLIVRASKEGEKAVFAEPQEWKGGGVRIGSLADAAQMLQQISKPYLDWAGKAERHEITVPTVPLFVHERHSTKAILDGIRHRKARGQSLDLFGDSQMDIRENLEAYEHKGPWQNRMILGDSLSVMNSLLEFEGMAGQVQMIYIDPPYGVKFGSNFQPFVRKRDVKHGGDEDMTREPEMVKAYRDTWELGLHSYLTYLRDRICVARELLAESGSLFVQISDENIHYLRSVLDEVFGTENFCSLITYQKTTYASSTLLPPVSDYILWYAKKRTSVKYRQLFNALDESEVRSRYRYVAEGGLRNGVKRMMSKDEVDGLKVLPVGSICFMSDNLTSPGFRANTTVDFVFEGKTYFPRSNLNWKTTVEGLKRLAEQGRLFAATNSLRYVRSSTDFPFSPIKGLWTDTTTGSFLESKLYVVQTAVKALQRCLLMTTDPGDLVLDPTCGSGTTAYVAEQWGRRWIRTYPDFCV